MSKKRRHSNWRPTASAPIRVTEEQIASDLGIPVAEVTLHLNAGIDAGWVKRLGPGLFALTIPTGVRVG